MGLFSQIQSLSAKQIFLVDAIGALITAGLLVGLIALFESFFGIPSKPANVLAMIAVAFAAYSGFCFVFLKRRWSSFLIPIIIANTTYCLITLGVIILYIDQITVYGVIYFLFEMAIVLLLVSP